MRDRGPPQGTRAMGIRPDNAAAADPPSCSGGVLVGWADRDRRSVWADDLVAAVVSTGLGVARLQATGRGEQLAEGPQDFGGIKLRRTGGHPHAVRWPDDHGPVRELKPHLLR